MTYEEVWEAVLTAMSPGGGKQDRPAAIAVLRQHLTPRPTGDDGELVKRLRDTGLQSPAEAADRIEALTAEVERLRVECQTQYDRGYYDGRAALNKETAETFTRSDNV